MGRTLRPDDPEAWPKALLPHGPGFRLVDRLESVRLEPAELEASYRVPDDHPILAAHFPGQPMWPGAYTIEGLAQAAGLLAALLELGVDHLETTSPEQPALQTWLVRADVKLVARVFAGDEIVYTVRARAASGGQRECEVEAAVGPRAVARGSVTLRVALDVDR